MYRYAEFVSKFEFRLRGIFRNFGCRLLCEDRLPISTVGHVDLTSQRMARPSLTRTKEQAWSNKPGNSEFGGVVRNLICVRNLLRLGSRSGTLVQKGWLEYWSKVQICIALLRMSRTLGLETISRIIDRNLHSSVENWIIAATYGVRSRGKITTTCVFGSFGSIRL